MAEICRIRNCRLLDRELAFAPDRGLYLTCGRGKSAGYRDVKTYGPDDEVPLILEGRELGRIKVSEVLA